MRAEVFWVEGNFPGRVAVVPRPRGGEWLEDEVAEWSRAGLNAIVSMLDADEIELFNLVKEADLSKANGILFFSFPVIDRGVPVSKSELLELLKKLKSLLAGGKNVGIHCRQSIGRAALLAASLMVLFGVEPDEAFRRLSEARGVDVPETEEQRIWVKRFAEELATSSR
jgi:protein-tyrosine phosphatase